MRTVPFDFMIHTGDIAYENGSREELQRTFFEIYADLITDYPIFPVTGNHDYRTEDAATFRRMMEKGSLPAVGVATDDCRKTHDELAAKGVDVIQEPADRPYGVEAILRDNSGNWLVLVEQKPFDGGEFGPGTS